MAIDKKRINKRAEQIDEAWKNGAPDAKFKGHTHADLVAARASIKTKEQRAADLRAQADLIDNEVDDEYVSLDVMLVDVRKGVEGHEDYGDDHPILSTMGFVRKSERKSGLHRNQKDSGDDDDENK